MPGVSRSCRIIWEAEARGEELRQCRGWLYLHIFRVLAAKVSQTIYGWIDRLSLAASREVLGGLIQARGSDWRGLFPHKGLQEEAGQVEWETAQLKVTGVFC